MAHLLMDVRLWLVVLILLLKAKLVTTASTPSSRLGDLQRAIRRGEVVNTTECHTRLLTYEFALTLVPERQPFFDAFDALELEATCGVARPTAEGARVCFPPPPGKDAPPDVGAFYVAADGDDEKGDGSVRSPFRTVQRAVEASRDRGGRKEIYLRGGVHYVGSTIQLDGRDSGLLLANYPNESAWVSGGVALVTTNKWTVHDAARSIYKTKISASDVGRLKHRAGSILALHVLEPHRRLVRARFPNCGGSRGFETRCAGVRGDKVEGDDIEAYAAPPVVPAARQVWVDARPSGYEASGSWQNDGYASAICDEGEACPCAAWRDVDEAGVWASASYWCSNISNGGWSEMDQGGGKWNGPVLPTGVSLKKTSALAQRAATWNATRVAGSAIVTAWRAQGWFVNGYLVDDLRVQQTPEDNDATLVEVRWSYGGFQGGRGWQVDGDAGTIDPKPPLFVENVLEELDEADEWYFDEATATLYYAHNASLGAFDDWTFIAADEARLVEVAGADAAHPIAGLTIRGLGFRDASPTFMDPWGVPSGGDWALHRGGAVFVQNAVNFTITDSLFRRVDGNALFFSGFTRDALVERNEFAWVGDCAMAAWGYTDGHDGTSGAQPRRLRILHNVAHEVGLYQLQSSMWFQAKAAENVLRGNVFFNGPRSAVNFNDGFGGGTLVERNAIWNACRQSGDHGPINSWDRQGYLTDVRDGTPSWTPAFNVIRHNVIIANYGGSQGVDNDDGSAWYDIHHNFIYGEGLKMDYGGHDSTYHGNVNVVHPYDGQQCINVWSFRAAANGPCVDGTEAGHTCSHAHLFFRNRCVLLTEAEEGYGQLQGVRCLNDDGSFNPHALDAAAHLFDNQYFSKNGSVFLKCPDKNHLAPLATVAAGGIDRNSTEAPIPSDETIMQWARDIVGF